MSEAARRKALDYHRKARRALAEGRSPVPDLQAAARLLGAFPAERALVLHDLGVALHREGDPVAATRRLNEAEALIRGLNEHDLLIAIRHARARIADEAGDARGSRDAWRAAAEAMRDLGEENLGSAFDDDADARARRAQAVEEELARLKEELRRRQS